MELPPSGNNGHRNGFRLHPVGLWGSLDPDMELSGSVWETQKVKLEVWKRAFRRRNSIVGHIYKPGGFETQVTQTSRRALFALGECVAVQYGVRARACGETGEDPSLWRPNSACPS